MYQDASGQADTQAKTESTPGTTCRIVSLRGIGDETDVASTLLARDYKGFGNQGMTGIVEKYSGGGYDR